MQDGYGDWSQDACPSWDWSGWQGYQGQSSWYDSRWSWDKAAGDWWSWEPPSLDPSTMSAEAAKVHALLQRGHTVDRLSDEQLQDVVAQIDSLKKSRQQQQQPAQPSPAKLQASPQRAPKVLLARVQQRRRGPPRSPPRQTNQRQQSRSKNRSRNRKLQEERDSMPASCASADPWSVAA